MKTFSQFFAESEVRGSFDSDPGSEEYQDALIKARKAKQKQKDDELAANVATSKSNLRKGFVVGSQDGKMGKFYKDAVTGKYTVFKPD